MTKPELGAKSGPAPTELVINDITVGAVSYTHLTLPTIYSV